MAFASPISQNPTQFQTKIPKLLHKETKPEGRYAKQPESWHIRLLKDSQKKGGNKRTDTPYGKINSQRRTVAQEKATSVK